MCVCLILRCEYEKKTDDIVLLCSLKALLTKLDSEKANVQADIEQGKRLQQDRNAPTFISQTVSDLDRKWRDTTQLAEAKHTKLKVRWAPYARLHCGEEGGRGVRSLRKCHDASVIVKRMGPNAFCLMRGPLITIVDI